MLVVVALLGAAAPARADTKVVTFDNLMADTPVSDQYRTSHGVYFRGPDAGDGWYPMVRSAPGVAHSGSQVADVSTCTAVTCEGFTPRSIGRLTATASAIGVYVGYTGSDQPPPTAEITLSAFGAPSATLPKHAPHPGEPPPPPDFSISVPSDPANVPEGDSVDSPVSINRVNGSDGDITL